MQSTLFTRKSIIWLSVLTDGKSRDVVCGVARCGEVAGGCTGQVEHTTRQRCRICSGHDDSVTVSPSVVRLRVTVRRTRQHVTLLERRSTRRRYVHCSRTNYTRRSSAYFITNINKVECYQKLEKNSVINQHVSPALNSKRIPIGCFTLMHLLRAGCSHIIYYMTSTKQYNLILAKNGSDILLLKR